MRVVSAVADVDREGKGFFLTFTVDEGQLYYFGGVDIESTLPTFNAESVRGRLLANPGDIYNAKLIRTRPRKRSRSLSPSRATPSAKSVQRLIATR